MGAHINIQTHELGDQRVGQIVDNKTFDGRETVAEALKYGYVVGKEDSICQMVKGVLRSMIDGVSKDGCGRKIDGLVSIQPQTSGRLADACDPLDLTKIKVYAIARMLKELALDTSDWTFTVEGGTATLSVTSITSGEAIGEIIVGEDIAINGSGLAMAAADTISWALADGSKSGTVPTAKRQGDETRITITGDVLSELSSSTYDGAVIVFTLNVGGKKAVKSATLHVV